MEPSRCSELQRHGSTKNKLLEEEGRTQKEGRIGPSDIKPISIFYLSEQAGTLSEKEAIGTTLVVDKDMKKDCSNDREGRLISRKKEKPKKESGQSLQSIKFNLDSRKLEISSIYVEYRKEPVAELYF